MDHVRGGLIAVILVGLLVLGGCRVDADEMAVDPTPVAADDGLPVIGPVPGASHWHAAYVVRVCDDVLAPFESDADPLGIHSHGDGVIHVHPFFEESGYERATLGLFGEAMGFGLTEGLLTLPGGVVWRDGDLCGGVPSRVFVDRWRDLSTAIAPERIFTDLEDIRFEADGELYQIAFAPFDSTPVVPPSRELVRELSVLEGATEPPWVAVPEDVGIDAVRVWPAIGVTTMPCEEGEVAERVIAGTPACFREGSGALAGVEAIASARAVSFNRQPAVELEIRPALQQLIAAWFEANPTDMMTLVIEVDGFVVTAPRLQQVPVSDHRLVVAGGFSAESARALAEILTSAPG